MSAWSGLVIVRSSWHLFLLQWFHALFVLSKPVQIRTILFRQESYFRGGLYHTDKDVKKMPKAGQIKSIKVPNKRTLVQSKINTSYSINTWFLRSKMLTMKYLMRRKQIYSWTHFKLVSANIMFKCISEHFLSVCM